MRRLPNYWPLLLLLGLGDSFVLGHRARADGIRDQKEVQNALLNQAIDRQQNASRHFADGNQEAAAKDLGDAIQALEKLRDTLAWQLMAVSRQHVTALLQDLNARCEIMQKTQGEILAETRDLQTAIRVRPEKDPTRADELMAAALTQREGQLGQQAAKIVQLLQQEFSSGCYLEVAFQHIRADIAAVGQRLAKTDVGPATQEKEQDIVTALKKLSTTLRREEPDLFMICCGSNPGIVPIWTSAQIKQARIERLKLIHWLQTVILERTERIGKQLEGEQADDRDLRAELKVLGERQQKVSKLIAEMAAAKDR